MRRTGSLTWVPFGYPPLKGPYHIAREVEKNGWRLYVQRSLPACEAVTVFCT
jgi:hypothetical protein